MNQDSAFDTIKLPTRLRQVHDLLLQAESEKRIAMKLNISPHTVHDHVKELYRRAGVNTRSEYLVRALNTPGSSPGRFKVRPKPRFSMLTNLVTRLAKLERRKKQLLLRIAEVAQALSRRMND